LPGSLVGGSVLICGDAEHAGAGNGDDCTLLAGWETGEIASAPTGLAPRTIEELTHRDVYRVWLSEQSPPAAEMARYSISRIFLPNALRLIVVEVVFVELPVRVVVEVIGDLADDVAKLEWLKPLRGNGAHAERCSE